jgi:hypothetical protein
MVISDKSTDPSQNYSSYLTYLENLQNVIASRCVVDIVQDGQYGLTIRVFEAAVYQKKLLTNNKTILETDLYNKNNVFILDYDDIETIDDFMQKETIPISNAVLQKYDINIWLQEFL